jgi:RNA polymerase sigma factor (sigma-70 family)
MAGERLTRVLRHLHLLTAARQGEDLSDGQALERFLSARDQAAFRALVQRHSPLVWGVCRRLLRHREDAEDVFQATFLVLARKAGSIRKPDSVGSWLCGVAYHLALEARSHQARRATRERQVRTMPQPESPPEALWPQLAPVLDEELQKLPAKYRRPLVLCYLEGKSYRQAAAELGWPLGSTSKRLARGRELLRQGLTRRGRGDASGTGANPPALRFRDPPNGSPLWPGPVTTDRRGRCTLRGLPRDLGLGLQVRDRRFSWQALAIKPQPQAKPRDITRALHPARVIEGTVVDGATGKPVPGARVRVPSRNGDSDGAAPGDPSIGEMDWKGRWGSNGYRLRWVAAEPSPGLIAYFLKDNLFGRKGSMPAREVSAPDEMPPVQARADRKGRFRLPLFVAGSYTVAVSGPPAGPYLSQVQTFGWPHADPLHYSKGFQTDTKGNISLRVLIPGATYRIFDPDGNAKDFTVEPGKSLDLGKVTVKQVLPLIDPNTGREIRP